MRTQSTLTEQEASLLIEDPRFGLDERWRKAAVARALTATGSFEGVCCLSNAIRAFMGARETAAATDRFLKLWTAVNALCGHTAARFEAAQAAHLGRNTDQLPARFRIQMIDNASIGALAALVDPAHPLPYFTVLHSLPFCEAQRTLGDLAEDLTRECGLNPRGALAQLSEAPSTPATRKLFALTGDLGISPQVFVLLVASYQLRNGLIHGSIPLPLTPDERIDGLEALELCSLALDAFLDRTLPQAVRQLQTNGGGIAPFPESYRQAIARYLDHRFDGQGIGGFLRKHGLLW